MIFHYIFFSIASVKYYKLYKIGHKYSYGLFVKQRRLCIFRKNKQISFAWSVLLSLPPSRSRSHSLSILHPEYINLAPAERIFGKPEYENVCVNMSRNSIFIVIGQKHRTTYMTTVSFLTAMRCSTIQTIIEYCIAVRKAVTRKSP